MLTYCITTLTQSCHYWNLDKISPERICSECLFLIPKIMVDVLSKNQALKRVSEGVRTNPEGHYLERTLEGKQRKCVVGKTKAAPGEVGNAVKCAINIGYRHIDCALLYGNEKEIGEAVREKIRDGTVKREDLFIVTKLWNTFHEREQVIPTCKKSLENFGLDYIDLYLIHWPVAQKLIGELDFDFPFKNAVGYDYDYIDTWKGMEECVDLGLTKSIGLSNFNSKQVQRVLDSARIKPVMNQIEVSPNINQKKLIKFCRDRGIEITAYSPFGSPGRAWAKPGDPVLHLTDPKLVAIGKKYNKTSAQVVLRYVYELGTIPIPKSTNKQRLAANLDIFDFELSKGDISVLDQLNCDGRAIPALELRTFPHYPFKDVEF